MRLLDEDPIVELPPGVELPPKLPPKDLVAREVLGRREQRALHRGSVVIGTYPDVLRCHGMEARSGIEPLYTALQAAASPLCHLAGRAPI